MNIILKALTNLNMLFKLIIVILVTILLMRLIVNYNSIHYQHINFIFLNISICIFLFLHLLSSWIINIIYGKSRTIYQRIQDALTMMCIIVTTCILLSLVVLCIGITIPFIFRLSEYYDICCIFFDFYHSTFPRSSLYINCLIILFLYLLIDRITSANILHILLILMILLPLLIYANISVIIILANLSEAYSIEFTYDSYFNILYNTQSLNFYNQYIYVFNYTNINYCLYSYKFNCAEICIVIHLFFIISYILILFKVMMIFYKHRTY